MCTGIRLIAQNGSVIYGRTLEFAQNMESEIIIIPCNYEFIGTPPSGKAEGLRWSSKFAVVGANGAGVNHIVDGLNEKGLAGGLFYLPNYAHYQEVTRDAYSKTIAPWELMTWILTNFSSVEEVKKSLPTINVANTIFADWGFVPPVHAVVHDVHGKSLVIEYVNGDLKLYDNPLGVITNSPTFDWHIINLNNYINLSAQNNALAHINNQKLVSIGQGSGMLGLPGDFTSPSRFIRAVAFSQTVIVGDTEEQALDAVVHVLNLFNIPIGVVRSNEDGKEFYDFTQWTSFCDMHNKCYYFHTYDNPQLQKIDLRGCDLESKSPHIFSMHKMQTISDLLKNKG